MDQLPKNNFMEIANRHEIIYIREGFNKIMWNFPLEVEIYKVIFQKKDKLVFRQTIFFSTDSRFDYKVCNDGHVISAATHAIMP